ncbi:MAG: nucleotidyl transferase AbiEii/AbiGii toxin family protein [Thermoplasmata archaeon]
MVQRLGQGSGIQGGKSRVPPLRSEQSDDDSKPQLPFARYRLRDGQGPVELRGTAAVPHRLDRGAEPPPGDGSSRLLEGDPAAGYSAPIRVTAYDPREILVEKCRAILTRTTAKSRDLVDLFLLERDPALRAERFEAQIVEKTRRAVQWSARYRRQAEELDTREALLVEEEVGPLLLKPIDMVAFQRHRERVVAFLKGLLPQILA